MINALKRRIAKFMAGREYVRMLVKQDLARDSNFIGTVADSFHSDPDQYGALLRHPAFFGQVLDRLSRNPEALYEMLQGARFRRRLRAQADLLSGMAQDEKVVRGILQRVPSARRGLAIRNLLQQDADLLNEFENDESTLLGAALMHLGQDDGPQAEPEEALTMLRNMHSAVVRLAQSDITTFADTLAKNNPAAVGGLLESDAFSTSIVAAIATDRKALSQVMELATVQLREGNTTLERVLLILEMLADLPAFRTAMQRDPKLRQRLAALTQDSYDSAGETVEISARSEA